MKKILLVLVIFVFFISLTAYGISTFDSGSSNDDSINDELVITSGESYMTLEECFNIYPVLRDTMIAKIKSTSNSMTNVDCKIEDNIFSYIIQYNFDLSNSDTKNLFDNSEVDNHMNGVKKALQGLISEDEVFVKVVYKDINGKVVFEKIY